MDGDDAALVIICGWNWDCWDCDDPNAVPPSRALSEVINDLAMCGSDSPVRTIASLLAAGKLTAMGRWRWQEYKGFEHYQSEGNGVIPAAQQEGAALAPGIAIVEDPGNEVLLPENALFGHFPRLTPRNYPPQGIVEAFSDPEHCIAVARAPWSGVSPTSRRSI